MDPTVVAREAADLEAALEASRLESELETSRLEAVMAASRVEAEAVAARAAAASRAEAAAAAVTAMSLSSMGVLTASTSSAADAATVATPLPEVCAICYETPEPLEVALLPTCSHSYCVSCVLSWAGARPHPPPCPLCKTSFSSLLVRRSLDGTPLVLPPPSTDLFFAEEPLALLLRVPWVYLTPVTPPLLTLRRRLLSVAPASVRPPGTAVAIGAATVAQRRRCCRPARTA
eukprot:TRINITY_DN1018_c0_g1_i2.p1 TRINITY_DN1018_c0_g1~~TRINITY_DN1018_c0_g1_i2.p1  ORF type:complete len:232 (+),score=45.39 TRINITY_DN1018_c0_g1_i2:55-750(+)